MKMEKENKKMYKDTFDEVHASENLLRKVKDMKRENISRIKRISKKAVCTAAALAVVGFISTNAVVYAATGSTWLHKVKVSIDGKEYEAKVTKIDEDTVEVEITGDEDMLYTISAEGDGSNLEESKFVICDESTGVYLGFENDRLYLIYPGNKVYSNLPEIENNRYYLISDEDKKIDITDNFNNGVCEGDMEIGDKVYHYVVTEDGGVYGLYMEEC